MIWGLVQDLYRFLICVVVGHAPVYLNDRNYPYNRVLCKRCLTYEPKGRPWPGTNSH